jgi:DNA-binding transcriptional LysR family regulator
VRRSLNLTWIRSFEASVRPLSFAKAAQELALTQAGVSQHVRMLEHEVGEPLFLRRSKAVRLTDAGSAYLHVVQESLERLCLGTSDIFGVASEGLVRLRAARLSSTIGWRLDCTISLTPIPTFRCTSPSSSMGAAGVISSPEAALLQTDSGATALVLAEQGAGVALSHSSLVLPLLRQGRLKRPFASSLETVGYSTS